MYFSGFLAFAGGAFVVEDFGPLNRVLRVQPLCDPAPRSGCHQPFAAGTAKLLVKDFAEDGRDAVTWRWTRGSATTLGEFGDPAALDYDLCVYETATPHAIFEASAPAGATCDAASCWAPKGSGFQYRDRDLRAPDGLFKVILGSGTDGQAKIIVKAKGQNVLDDFGLPLTSFPLTVQLQASNGACWEATYSASGATVNTDVKLKAVSD